MSVVSEHAPVVDALVSAAADGVSMDGLVVERTNGSFRLSTPATEPLELDRSALRDRLSEALDAPTTALDDPLAIYVSNWYHWTHRVDPTANRAFLRWCERAPPGEAADGARSSPPNTLAGSADPIESVADRYDALAAGIEREWGQLLLTARLDSDGDPGERIYDCRHVDDREAEPSSLTTFADPRAARELATEDAKGRYRPLSTAPTLVDGWQFVGLEPGALVSTVDFFYPATIPNWDRERRGELDVDHWIETAERQTGIYDVVDELPREAVEWMAEACCVDSQCLRRREWGYSEADALSVDGGDGQFPCREPCSLVISAARKWAIAESESDKRVTLELTTSELNQLSELVDAVADGRVDEIREADLNEGANRYRARYLRAKRFDETGALPVTAAGDGETTSDGE